MMTKKDIIAFLNCRDKKEIDSFFNQAYKIKLDNVGNKVYLRGIIELSNICTKDCFYCGIRKSNNKVNRFCMSEKDIIESALFSHNNRHGSVVLQSGERCDIEFIDFIEKIIKTIKKETNGKLGITLSLGEQAKDTYKRWFDAGAHRYLLRIETSDESFYKRLHPEDHDYKNRLNCLKWLKEIGYQTGTGVMIGLPGQSYESLADDIYFFKDNDIDMIGMGPYVLHENTPLASRNIFNPDRNFELGLKMIALTRVNIKDINIAATTALQTLNPDGYRLGLKAGANIVMPNITPLKYRKDYQLYEGKAFLNESSEGYIDFLANQVKLIGEEIGYSEWGDSPHFYNKKTNNNLV